MVEKRCKRCGMVMPIVEFYKVPSMRYRHDNTCKTCRRELRTGKTFPRFISCPICGTALPNYMFALSSKSNTGRRWCCNSCWERKTTSPNNFRKSFDSEFKLRIYTQKRDSRIRNFIHSMWKAAKTRAIHKGIEFTITESDIIIPDKCPLFGVSFIYGTKGNFQYSPSLDRIDNSKGYIPGNIWVICQKANLMKNSATMEELISFCNSILRYSPSYTKTEGIELKDKEP